MQYYTQRKDNGVIVVGGSLSAVLYAYLNNHKLMFVEPIIPHLFEKEKRDVWGDCSWLLSIAGMIPTIDCCAFLTLDQDKKTITANSTKTELGVFSYKQLIIFDNWEHIRGIPEPTSFVDPFFELIDYYTLRVGSSRLQEGMDIPDNDLIQRMHYFPAADHFSRSCRLEGRALACVIELTKDEIPLCSEVLVRTKARTFLHKTYPIITATGNKQAYIINHQCRVERCIREEEIYTDTESIIFKDHRKEEATLLDEYKNKKMISPSQFINLTRYYVPYNTHHTKRQKT